MRTTIRIDDALYRAVKAKAARSGRTVAAVLEDAVRRGLDRSEDKVRGRYHLEPLGHGGARADIDLSSSAAVNEILDEGRAADALR
ncbi:ribbon-helix-helix domain-containing protein [Mycolicibacterium moriokaense]|uniref:Ribbon-helix-helix CopG family protein n=1 Tax=Mycolicibacterium moriokaense TaxID=39691 RepID=A0A318HCJ9_9MYCO|nr:ribbon-helix-helix domain-containing protein [Mycolicibacterium moriokaense]PXX03231.1 ribbon-helix-helix CopG family protein [Mycolicibacterium moriokaense]